nr:COP9 signalosome complex subunit 1-like [Dermatophagoides farinae]
MIMSFPNHIEPMQLDASIDVDVDVDEASDLSNSDNNFHIIDSSPFEVETYASQYSGHSKLIRLMYIADHCPPLQIDALEQAMKYVKAHTFNVSMYLKIHGKLVAAQNGQPSEQANVEPLDNGWIEKQTKLSQIIFEKLETDLKNYKTNSIKESIRRGHDDLGSHHLLCGDLTNALKYYTRSRDYCMGDHHLFTIFLNVIKLNIYLQNWTHVGSHIQKAETGEFSSNQTNKSKINCIAGLLNLVNTNYKQAAERFVKAHIDDLKLLNDILSPNNVAIYGGLCALASFDRDELRKKVLHNSDFRIFLELEPQLREAISRFLESKYPDCLKLLDELKDAFLLDIYLAPHVKQLYNLIRSRALIQYFTPYLSANLNRMASAFNTSVTALEDELMRLILEGMIQARIDSHNKILYAKDTDLRLSTFETVIEKGRDWQMKATSLILRTACARNGMITIRQQNYTQSQQQQQQQQPLSNNTSTSLIQKTTNNSTSGINLSSPITSNEMNSTDGRSPSSFHHSLPSLSQNQSQSPSSPGNPMVSCSPSSPPPTTTAAAAAPPSTNNGCTTDL